MEATPFPEGVHCKLITAIHCFGRCITWRSIKDRFNEGGTPPRTNNTSMDFTLSSPCFTTSYHV